MGKEKDKKILDMVSDLKTTDKLVLVKALSEALYEEYFPGGETIHEYGNRVYEIPIELIDHFPLHPFNINDDAEMSDLTESVMANGVLVPAILRKKEDGRYEMLSGHRRLRACELAGIDTLKSIVLNISRDEAAIIMVETNRQRVRISPSEKAFSYKIRKDALERMKKMESRNYLLSGRNYRVKNLAEIGLEPKDTGLVSRLIRLTELIPEMMDYVDDGKISFRPAYEISFLSPKMQKKLLYCIEYEQCTPSHAQTKRMRKLTEEHALTAEVIEEIMAEEKPNQKPKVIIRNEKTLSHIPDEITDSEKEEYIAKALEFYERNGGNHGKNAGKDTGETL